MLRIFQMALVLDYVMIVSCKHLYFRNISLERNHILLFYKLLTYFVEGSRDGHG